MSKMIKNCPSCNRDINCTIYDILAVSDCLKDRIEEAKIYTEVPGSDHCPVGLDLTE